MFNNLINFFYSENLLKLFFLDKTKGIFLSVLCMESVYKTSINKVKQQLVKS
jgi:hypothetical protein